MSMNNEMELKGVFKAEQLEQLKSLSAITELAVNKAVSRVLTTTYFDTPDNALNKHGYSFRVRKSGKTHTQCLKRLSQPLGAIIGRTEWETEIPDQIPQIDLLENKKIRNKLKRLTDGNLQAVSQSVVRRQSRKLKFEDGTTVSLDIDVGEVIAGDEVQPICEFELELLSGSAAHIFELGRIINQTVPFRISTVSKAARGYSLLSKEEPRAQKWQRPKLLKSFSAEQAVVDKLQQTISSLQANEASVLLDDAEGIHQMRVALRRLRAGLEIFQSNIVREKYDWIVSEANWLRDELSAARSWDVFIDEFVEPVTTHSRSATGFESLLSVAEKERVLHREQARNAVNSARYTEFILELSIWRCRAHWWDSAASSKAIDLSEPVRKYCAKQLKKQNKIVRKKFQKLGKKSEDERHKLRLAVKKLRYTIDFCANIYPDKQVSIFQRKLNPVQAGLGYLNDVLAAELLIEKLMGVKPDPDTPAWLYTAGIVIGWHRREAKLTEKKLFKHVNRFLETNAFWDRK